MSCVQSIVDITVNKSHVVNEISEAFGKFEESGYLVTQFILSDKTNKKLHYDCNTRSVFFQADGSKDIMFWSALVYINNSIPENKIVLVGEKVD